MQSSFLAFRNTRRSSDVRVLFLFLTVRLPQTLFVFTIPFLFSFQTFSVFVSVSVNGFIIFPLTDNSVDVFVNENNTASADACKN